MKYIMEFSGRAPFIIEEDLISNEIYYYWSDYHYDHFEDKNIYETLKELQNFPKCVDEINCFEKFEPKLNPIPKSIMGKAKREVFGHIIYNLLNQISESIRAMRSSFSETEECILEKIESHSHAIKELEGKLERIRKAQMRRKHW